MSRRHSRLYAALLAFGRLAATVSTTGSADQHEPTVLIEYLPMDLVCCDTTWSKTIITRTAFQLKGIYPDSWPNTQQVWDATPGGQSQYLVWADWEPTKKAPPCAADEQEYDGHCFVIIPAVDAAIFAWTKQGRVTTAIVYGTPEWARGKGGCTAGIYCVPDDAADFGRFAGMLARRYNGLNGNGRIADFVLNREVGNVNYFNIGCGSGVPCDKASWIDKIAENYIAGYDAVFAEQSTAWVMTSIDNRFGLELDDAPGGQLSGMTVLRGLADKVGGRLWRVSINAYNKPGEAESSYFDFPYVTLGNIGVLVGWLYQQFPNVPQLRTVQLVEQGIPGRAPTFGVQERQLCVAYHNVLGTPGIENYIYYQIQDQSQDLQEIGLHQSDGTPKPAWTKVFTSKLGCGFSELPFLQLRLAYNGNTYITSTRIPSNGYLGKAVWFIPRAQEPGTVMLFECRLGETSFLTTDSKCDNQLPYGPAGWIYTSQVPGSIPLYSCYNEAKLNYFLWAAEDCNGAPNTNLGVIGYAYLTRKGGLRK
ncbi:hypothetical protein DCS_06251 [Drechmeria coniospora]|uniref:DUF5722 domain-containing protein n=1 Tax=Drechmeria coniospora TaxID=98403 RepID=A0A151GB67_DRECN|nr:hypothetical protein DCS_06251 [Drechmeria coniospora]KYK54294.1 hypothetical protein DCS_06251 [Drechmeria coniospora]